MPAVSLGVMVTWIVAELPGATYTGSSVVSLVSPSTTDQKSPVLDVTSGENDWDWVRWLPHCHPASGQDCAVLIGNDAESVAARIAELLAIVAAIVREHEGSVGVESAGPEGGARFWAELPAATASPQAQDRVGSSARG